MLYTRKFSNDSNQREEVFRREHASETLQGVRGFQWILDIAEGVLVCFRIATLFFRGVTGDLKAFSRVSEAFQGLQRRDFHGFTEESRGNQGSCRVLQSVCIGGR